RDFESPIARSFRASERPASRSSDVASEESLRRWRDTPPFRRRETHDRESRSPSTASSSRYLSVRRASRRDRRSRASPHERKEERCAAAANEDKENARARGASVR